METLFIKSFYFYQPRLLSGASECNISVGNILPVRELTKLKIHSEAVTIEWSLMWLYVPKDYRLDVMVLFALSYMLISRN